MDRLAPRPTDLAQAAADRMHALERGMKGGASWFFWIAGLSALNSTTSVLGAVFPAVNLSLTFVVGLGITQLVDAIALTLAHDLGARAGTIVLIVGFALNLIIAAVFAICGVFGRTRSRAAIVVGMVLYALDTALLAAIGDWLSLIFHVIALFGLGVGLRAISELMALEKALSAGDTMAVERLLASRGRRAGRV